MGQCEQDREPGARVPLWRARKRRTGRERRHLVLVHELEVVERVEVRVRVEELRVFERRIIQQVGVIEGVRIEKFSGPAARRERRLIL